MIDFRKKKYLSSGQVEVSNATAEDVPATPSLNRDGLEIVVFDTANHVYFDPIGTATSASFPLREGDKYDFQCTAAQTLSALADTAPVIVGYLEYRYV